MKGTGKIWIIFDAAEKRQTKPMSTLQTQMTLLNLKSKDMARFFLWTPGWTEWVPLAKFMESDQTYFVIAPAPAPAGMPKPPTLDDEKTVRAGGTFNDDDTVTHVFDSTPQMPPDGDDGYTTIVDVASTAAPGKPDYGYYADDFSAEKIDTDAKHSVQFNLPQNKKPAPSPSDRRIEERHQFKIEVILVNKHGRTFRTYSQNISLGGTLLEEDLPKEFINSRFDLILVNKFERNPAKGRLHFQGRVVGDYQNPRRLMFLDTDDHTRQRLQEMLQSYIDQQKKMKARQGA